MDVGKTIGKLKARKISEMSVGLGAEGQTLTEEEREAEYDSLQNKELARFSKTHLFAITGAFKGAEVSYLFSCPSQMELLKWKRKLGSEHRGELINVTPLMLAILSGRTLVANYLIKTGDIQLKDSKVRQSVSASCI